MRLFLNWCFRFISFQGIMLVYDITNEKSFENIRNWIRNIEEVSFHLIFSACSSVILVYHHCINGQEEWMAGRKGERFAGCHKKIFGCSTYKHDLIRKLCIGCLFKHAQRRTQIGRPCTPDGANGVLWCPGGWLAGKGWGDGWVSSKAANQCGISVF